MAANVEAAEVYELRTSAHTACFEANHLKRLEHLESGGMALRVWNQHRPGLAVAHGPFDQDTLVAQAIALSELHPPQDYPLSASVMQPAQLDRGLAVPAEQLIRWGHDSIDRILDAHADCSCSAEYECETEYVHLINSAGMECRYTDITLRGLLTAEKIKGQDFLCIEADQVQRNQLNPEALIELIEQRLAWAAERVPAPQGAVPVLFTPRAADTLWATLQAALNAQKIIEGVSPWSDRLGASVISPQLTLSQIPSLGPYSCPFDDEGQATQTLELVHQGELQLFYTDLRTGQLLGSGTTGNGFRPTLNQYPHPELINLVVQPGSKSFSEIIGALSDGILVDQVLGDNSRIGGDLSINVDLGYRIRQGKITGRVKDVMISGNTYQALQQVLMLGNDHQWNNIFYSPSILVGGLSVTA